jgi:hypothetical protein
VLGLERPQIKIGYSPGFALVSAETLTFTRSASGGSVTRPTERPGGARRRRNRTCRRGSGTGSRVVGQLAHDYRHLGALAGGEGDRVAVQRQGEVRGLADAEAHQRQGNRVQTVTFRMASLNLPVPGSTTSVSSSPPQDLRREQQRDRIGRLLSETAEMHAGEPARVARIIVPQ